MHDPWVQVRKYESKHKNAHRAKTPVRHETEEINAMIPGIDVSHYQGEIDWQKVKAAGIRFAYLKATQGASFIDSDALRELHWSESRRDSDRPISRVRREHWQRADFATGGRPESLFVPQLPCWLDIEPGAVSEETGQQVTDMLQGFLAGHDMVYCSPATGDQLFSWEQEISDRDYGLAMAHYGVSEPRIPKPWTTFQFWQHSASGTVDGISASVDLDWFNGTEDEFQMLISPKAT